MITIRCAWCKKIIAVKYFYGGEEDFISDGICPKCWRKEKIKEKVKLFFLSIKKKIFGVKK